MAVDMDYDDSVRFVRSHAFPGELHDLLRAPSRPYSYGRTTIHLTYFSMPDWLAVLSGASSHTNRAGDAAPIVDVIRGMSIESDLSSAVIDFLWLNGMAAAERERLFRRLAFAYKTAAAQHQKSVADCLDFYTRKGSGRALLKELGRTRHSINVVPHWLAFMTLDEGYSNASVRGVRAGQNLSHITDGLDADVRDTLAKGIRFGRHNRNRGTGKGADVVVYFSAGVWTDTVYKDYATGEAGYEADEVLYHELVHATRMLHGTETREHVDGRPNFGNIKEYFATVITNIYLSEKGARLVGAYEPDSRAHAPKDWSVMRHPADFYGNVDGLSIPPAQLMDTFKRTQRPFYDDLAALPTPPWFNPVRTHVRLTERIPV